MCVTSLEMRVSVECLSFQGNLQIVVPRWLDSVPEFVETCSESGGSGFPTAGWNYLKHRGGHGFPKQVRRFFSHSDTILHRFPECCFVRILGQLIGILFPSKERGTVIHDCDVVQMQLVHESFMTTTYQNPFGEFWITQWLNLHFDAIDIKNFRNPNIQDWTNLLMCINRSIWHRIFFVSGFCVFFTQRRAFSHPSSLWSVVI